jgi:hypothetical protein
MGSWGAPRRPGNGFLKPGHDVLERNVIQRGVRADHDIPAPAWKAARGRHAQPALDPIASHRLAPAARDGQTETSGSFDGSATDVEGHSRPPHAPALPSHQVEVTRPLECLVWSHQSSVVSREVTQTSGCAPSPADASISRDPPASSSDGGIRAFACVGDCWVGRSSWSRYPSVSGSLGGSENAARP